MASQSIQKMSRHLSHVLDCLGYSRRMIQKRRAFYTSLSELLSLENNNDPSICMPLVVGSRAEGVVKLYESDFDGLVFDNTLRVVEDNATVENIPESESVFRMVPCDTHPGYCKLLLIRQCPEDDILGTCLEFSENKYWLSSKKFVAYYKEDSDIISGPAVTMTHEEDFPTDLVYTIPFNGQTILQQWIKRPRRFDWPPVKLREYLINVPCNIVATGHNACSDEDIEWRICFNKFEYHLVETWNDSQIKLYKILKMLNKDVLMKNYNITSYIMKNVVMWLSEMYPQSFFRPDSLFKWVIKSLKYLRRAVKLHRLPYYMIPERNLIAEKIPICQQKGLIKELSNLIGSGHLMLLKCSKLKFAMSITPEELLNYREKIDRLEVLDMKARTRCKKRCGRKH